MKVISVVLAAVALAKVFGSSVEDGQRLPLTAEDTFYIPYRPTALGAAPTTIRVRNSARELPILPLPEENTFYLSYHPGTFEASPTAPVIKNRAAGEAASKSVSGIMERYDSVTSETSITPTTLRSAVSSPAGQVDRQLKHRSLTARLNTFPPPRPEDLVDASCVQCINSQWLLGTGVALVWYKGRITGRDALETFISALTTCSQLHMPCRYTAENQDWNGYLRTLSAVVWVTHAWEQQGLLAG